MLLVIVRGILDNLQQIGTFTNNMALHLLGINHHTAPLELREAVAFNQERLPGLLDDLSENAGIEEALILSTCNRTEIYTVNNLDTLVHLQDWLRRHADRADEVIERLYVKQAEQVVEHACMVASGLDSLVLGEPQIFGQLKSAHRSAQMQGTLGTQLYDLFEHAFRVAKKVRTETGIGQSSVSAASVAISLAHQVFGDLSNKSALLIGAGEMIEIAGEHLRANNINNMIIANRSADRGEALAGRLNCRAIQLDQIGSVLAHSDVIFSSTASDNHILTHDMISSALHDRKRRPMFIVDMAVPRDVDPRVGELPDVYLYTIDDLYQTIDENKDARAAEAEKARDIILEHISHFGRAQEGLSAAPLIRSLRGQGEQTKSELLTQAKRQLEVGKDPELVLTWLADRLTSKLLHAPSTKLREAAETSDQELMEAVRRLFNLEHK